METKSLRYLFLIKVYALMMMGQMEEYSFVLF